MKKKISVLMAVCMIILLCRYSPNTYCAAKQTTLGQKWTKNTSVGTNDLFKIAYGNGTFVAVGEDGEIQFSKDGTLWKKANSKTSEYLNQILWTGKNFIVLGSNSIFVSNDGATWNKVYSDTTNIDETEGLRDVVWNGKVFITAGGQYIITSKDGIKWTTKKLEEETSVDQIIWNGKSFIVNVDNTQSKGEYTELYFSADGYSWSKNSYKNLCLGNMVYYKGNLYALSYTEDSSSMVVTKDFKNWKTIFSSNDSEGRFRSLTYNGKELIIEDPGSDSTYITSSDGEEWNKIYDTNKYCIETNASISDKKLDKNKSLYVGEKILADEPYRANAIIALSSDGVNYKIINEFKDVLGFNDIIYAQGMYIIVGVDGAIMQSKDAKTWKKLRGGKGGSGSDNCDFNDIKWNGKIFVAVGSNGEVYTSADGLKWVAKSITNKDLLSVAWDGRQFLVSGENGLIFKSKDGVDWTQYKSNVHGYIYNIAYNGKIYVGIQNTDPNGGDFYAPSLVKLCYSSDGLNWDVYNIDTNIDCFTKVLWDGSKFVTFYHKLKKADNTEYKDDTNSDTDSDDGSGINDSDDSEDGGDSEGSDSDSDDVSVDSYVAYSLDGKTWTKKLIGADTSIDCVEYNGKQFTALTNNPTQSGKVFISKDGINWSQFAFNIKKENDGNLRDEYLKWINGKFVCISSNHEILMSSDGIKWTYYGQLPYEFLYAMEGNENILIIAGCDTTMVYSK